MMNDKVKDLLVAKIDEFLNDLIEIGEIEFPIVESTAVFFADAIEVLWNGMSFVYSKYSGRSNIKSNFDSE